MIHIKILFSIVLSLVTLQTYANDYKRLVLFGDSLSDMGTYSEVAKQYNGGKFTTNPGKLWIEHVANYYKLDLSINRTDGFNQPVQIRGGFNYAQGGARIKNEVGNGNDKGYSTRPLTTQLNYFIDEHQSFKSDDLIFIQGGANDILVLLGLVAKKIISPEQAMQEALTAANDLALVVEKIVELNGKNVVVLNLPQIEKTPKVITLDQQSQLFVKMMTQNFNKTLAAKLSKSPVVLLDIYSFDRFFNENYHLYGFKNITEQACATDTLPIKSSLVCSKNNLIEAGADFSYKFADAIHPTSGYSIVVGHYILNQLELLKLNK